MNLVVTSATTRHTLKTVALYTVSLKDTKASTARHVMAVNMVNILRYNQMTTSSQFSCKVMPEPLIPAQSVIPALLTEVKGHIRVAQVIKSISIKISTVIIQHFNQDLIATSINSAPLLGG